ncbi:PREDICTED: luciferin 4-monooxygenase [Dinoponera quadriceps]|uniref:Luciferin 4-monooxygenase n=1 Tax=Dinoponera quadriceps TaxID=609295 RepID=A0A6P3WN93_DINQU|nr:PREDICTED: luciferin 4-monooxygenase [Dinoponera quadriceps]XP_014467590.1 PREDICTED: luciferin 4-monooxygenase [Dinoponera quadriceps]XP_014467591.1 PREDICTED: luciferin 4-monooxygenase [Dinoponera quadriceps]
MSEKGNILYEDDIMSEWKDLSLGQLLLKQLTLHGTGVAQVNAHTDKGQTFEYMLNTSRKLAVFLQREGIKANDAIAICSENNLEFGIATCAIFYLGGVVCPLNPLYSEREFKHAFGISKPRYIFISESALNNIKNIIKDLYWSPKILMLTEHNNINVTRMNLSKAISSVSDNDINSFRAVPVDVNNHVAAILCSSGTTGLPKGVMLTDKNFTTAIKHVINLQYDEEKFPILALLPFFHAYSFVILLLRLISGGKCIVISRFDEELFLQCIEKYRVQSLLLVPPLMVFLAKHPLVDKYDLSSIKTIACGAAPLSEEIHKAVGKRLNVSEIREGYGLTETTLGVLWSTGDNTKPGRFILAPGTSAKIIPLGEFGTDKTSGPNCKGELCFKGDLIMKGYCNNEESTRATIDKDGWLHTGDVGYYDEEGYFYVVDRIKELIKYKGYQVPPAELEAILLTCPGVTDAAVIGIPDERAGELPMAFIVKQDNFNVCEKDIVQYVNERVSSPKRLRGGVRFVNSIPKTASGKILRRLLRDFSRSKL